MNIFVKVLACLGSMLARVQLQMSPNSCLVYARFHASDHPRRPSNPGGFFFFLFSFITYICSDLYATKAHLQRGQPVGKLASRFTNGTTCTSAGRPPK